jgi:Ribbon-helix-helix protein, copG family
MMNPFQRVNVDFTAEMLRELDKEVAGLNISRQAVIKTLVREALERRYSRRESPGEKSSRPWFDEVPSSGGKIERVVSSWMSANLDFLNAR